MRKAVSCIFLLCWCFFITYPAYGFEQSKTDTLEELLHRINILTEEIENLKHESATKPEVPYLNQFGMGPAASKVYAIEGGVSIAGYGEVVYNNFEEGRAGTGSSPADRIDYLRHVTYIGFRFSDWLLFNSEIEYEHAKAGDAQPGEVALEFGYVEAAISRAWNIRAGMMLIPVGIVNELHEPSTFHGSLRPDTERFIIPTTWRSNGIGLLGQFRGFDYKLYMTESLDASKFSSSGIRSGRQNGAEALAEDLAVSGRLSYSDILGLDFGGSFFVGNSGQNLTDSTGASIDAQVRLFALHATFIRHGFEFRGLYARSDIGQVSALNSILGLQDTETIGKSQSGFYFVAAYDILPALIPGTLHYLAPFFQFEKLNTQTDVPTGFSKNPAQERTNITVGLTYKPHPNVALKFDYINRDNEANSAVDQFNIALNYLF